IRGRVQAAELAGVALVARTAGLAHATAFVVAAAPPQRDQREKRAPHCSSRVPRAGGGIGYASPMRSMWVGILLFAACGDDSGPARAPMRRSMAATISIVRFAIR